MIYDPLVDHAIPANQPYPNSTWVTEQKKQYPKLEDDIETEVAIVGAGYTGLSTAYHLATKYKQKCIVIDANQPGWGCSGRNGGFVLPGSGRMSASQMTKKWGESTTRLIYQEFMDSVDAVNELISSGINCQRQNGGYIKLAHKTSKLESLHQQAIDHSAMYKNAIIPLTKTQIKNEYLGGVDSAGGIYFPKAFGINPWLFCHGLAELTHKQGVKIFGNTPLTACVDKQSTNGNKHVLHTPNATIRANTLVIASNAYHPNKLFPILKNKTFPVISSIIVTKPLNYEQRAILNMRKGLMVMDTRPMKYYYRLLPNNCLLFGGRGAVTGKHANDKKYRLLLEKGLFETFPNLQNVVVDKFWSGWVNISYDDYPRIHHNTAQNVLYSSGYCGAGLAFSVQAGKRLAQLLHAPHTLPSLPFWQSELKTYPLSKMRRVALHGLYALTKLRRA